MIKKNTFLQSSLSMLGQDVVVAALVFIANILLARWLGPTQLGLFYIINLIPSYSEKFGRLGTVDQAALYYLRKKKYPAGQIAGHLIIVTLFLSLLPLLLYAVFQSSFKFHFLKTSAIPDFYVWTMVATIPFIFLFIGFNKLLIGLDQIKEYGFLQISKSVIFFVLSIYFWWKKWDLFGLCLATLLSVVIPTVLNAFLLKTGPFQFRLNKFILKDFFGYGWKIYFITLVSFVHLRADLILVSFFLNPSDVSFYSIAVSGAQLLWKIPNAISTMLYARVSSEEKHKATELTAQAIRTALVVMGLVGGLGLIFIYPVITLMYGREFLPIIQPFIFLLPGVLSMGLARLLMEYFNGIENSATALKANFLLIPLNLLLNVILIPRFGISAAAMVSTVSYTIYLIVLAREFCQGGKIDWKDLFVFKHSDYLRFKSMLKTNSSRTFHINGASL